MEPGIIKRLDEVVVNRIAAGEIIQRPANALKEMLENSLDAKSTSIQITAKSGGLKFLQIQDNGTGIRREDLEIVCERFTTSKLQTFDDLSSMKTYGFRGEALASISHVAHLTIQTKTADPTIPCAYRATYSDGKLIGPPKSCAGNQGTQITVEDLFYNAPQRRQAFKSNAEEFQRINDVVSKYAVHNAAVGFCVKKQGENHSFRTQPGGTHRDNIALIYGSEVGRELIEIQLASDAKLQFSVSGFITNINYSTKKHSMLLFINNRLVKSSTLKAAIDDVYAMYLPRGSHPFVYISLSIDAANVDVNVHPTKHEVHFLYEDEIIEQIKQLIERTLLGSNDSRKYYSQTRLPGASDPSVKNDSQSEADVSMSQTVYAKDLVRSDSKTQKLEKFFGDVVLLQASQSDMSLVDEIIDVDREEVVKKTFAASTPVTTPVNQPIRSKKSNIVSRKKTELSSILKMRKQVEEDCSLGLRNILNGLIFVGCVNEKQTLIQHETMLYLCDNQMLGEALFYQILLYDFENFGEIKFEDPGLSVRELILLALDSEESGWTPEDGPIEDLATTVRDILVKKAIILREYYSFQISEDGRLLQLPLLLENHKPSLAHLPLYLLRLATEVDWESEQEFFQTFSRETASFYSIISTDPDSNNGSDTNNSSTWFIEHVLYAALKDQFMPPQQCTHNNSILQVASLSNLYKVFERC